MKYQRNSIGSGPFLAVILFGLVVFWLAGCSASSEIRAARQSAELAYEVQKPIVIRTSEDDNRPDWVKKSSYIDEGKMYFSGGFTDGADYSVSVRCANAEALKVAVQGIGQFIRAEFSGFVQGSNVGSEGGGLERYVSDGIATFADAMYIQGVKQSDIYYEELFSPTVMKPTFNIWVRLEMSRAEYMKAKADVVRQLRDKFGKDNHSQAKVKAERLLDELKGEIEEQKYQDSIREETL